MLALVAVSNFGAHFHCLSQVALNVVRALQALVLTNPGYLHDAEIKLPGSHTLAILLS